MRTRWRESRLVAFSFSRRRRHTSLVSDWSSDVCSSDLVLMIAEQDDVVLVQERGTAVSPEHEKRRVLSAKMTCPDQLALHVQRDELSRADRRVDRSEERRVGKEGGNRCRAYRERGRGLL